MEPGVRTVRIFIPSAALERTTCLLIGWRSDDRGVYCVTNYADINKSGKLTDKWWTGEQKSAGVQILGVWDNALDNPDASVQCQKWVQNHPDCIHLTKTNNELPECNLQNIDEKSPQTIVLIFDAHDLSASQLLESEGGETNLGVLCHGWATASGCCAAWKCEDVSSFCSLRSSLVDRTVEAVKHHITKLCVLLAGVIIFMCQSRFCRGVLCRVPKPVTVHHLVYRARQIESAATQKGTSPMLNHLRLTNLLWKQMIDVVLGLTVTYVLMSGNHTTALADTVMFSAQTVATELQRLLQWMMGVPAGLKLNHELAHFLGQFFLYHIYLWTGYLRFLAPFWKDAVQYIVMSGCLGLTFQISLLQDLLSMVTLHSYCFYVYAARLYSLQVYSLISLWRLFRGKKWNTLFQRVDSCSYDVDQLFIGTLLFTSLLFLLPTTVLFYSVFTALRLAVLMMQAVMYVCVSVLDAVPVYLFYLRLFRPRQVAGHVRLHVLPRLPNRPLYHALQLLPVSVTELWQMGNSLGIASDATSDTWGSIVNKVISGHLIYPWIKPYTS